MEEHEHGDEEELLHKLQKKEKNSETMRILQRNKKSE
jgi:hypothetical protein